MCINTCRLSLALLLSYPNRKVLFNGLVLFQSVVSCAGKKKPVSEFQGMTISGDWCDSLSVVAIGEVIIVHSGALVLPGLQHAATIKINHIHATVPALFLVEAWLALPAARSESEHRDRHH